MKKFLCALAMLVAGSANATVLTFENINLTNIGTYVTVAQANAVNYAGFTFDTDWYVGSTKHSNDYKNAANSGRNYLSNGSNVTNLTISSATAFTFNGAWFATPTHSNPAEWINITAYGAGNTLIGSTGNVAINSVEKFVAANFANVRSLNITRGDGWFTMDDFTFNEVVNAVPEPTSVALFGLAFLGLAAARRRKQK
jgi:hypothetical protein